MGRAQSVKLGSMPQGEAPTVTNVARGPTLKNLAQEPVQDVPRGINALQPIKLCAMPGSMLLKTVRYVWNVCQAPLPLLTVQVLVWNAMQATSAPAQLQLSVA